MEQAQFNWDSAVICYLAKRTSFVLMEPEAQMKTVNQR